MTNMKLATLCLLSATCFTACKSVTQKADMSNIALPGTESTYITKLTGRIEAEGTAFSLSPNFVRAFGGDTSKTIAYNVAVGKALWNRDGTDAMIGIKSRIETTDFMGLFETSTVEIKGIGVGVPNVPAVK